MKALHALKRMENRKPGSVCIKAAGVKPPRAKLSLVQVTLDVWLYRCAARRKTRSSHIAAAVLGIAQQDGAYMPSGFRVIVAAPYCAKNAITPTTRTHRHGLRCHGRGAGVAAAPAALSPSRGVFFRRVKSQPALSAVNGATVTSPKEPTTVSMISAETYL